MTDYILQQTCILKMRFHFWFSSCQCIYSLFNGKLLFHYINEYKIFLIALSCYLRSVISVGQVYYRSLSVLEITIARLIKRRSNIPYEYLCIPLRSHRIEIFIGLIIMNYPRLHVHITASRRWQIRCVKFLRDIDSRDR